MATELPNQGVPEDLRKRLSVAVRSIGWTYAIFWFTSRQPGVLEWGDGYYNGDIKTRKTVQAIELNEDQIGLQRSEQLRELYGSLSAGETSPQARRPSVALSPEDLSDTEWYYLVCMSFVFNVGQGLPGRALANGQLIWLCNAHISDSKVFSRSLLAKSASIQTVVAFPFLGGVVELGVTELVMEDPNLIQNIEGTFMENPFPIISTKLSSMPRSLGDDDDDDVMPRIQLDCEILENVISLEENEEVKIDSPDTMFYQGEDAFMVEGVNEGPSQVQSWHFKDDFSNAVQNSANSSDCISQTFLNPKKDVSNCILLEPREGNYVKQSALDLRSDVHHQDVPSAVVKSSDTLDLGPHFGNCRKESCFASWKQEGLLDSYKRENETSQKLLKKVLFEVAQMHSGNLLETKTDESGTNPVLLERKERENMNKRFDILMSMVPKIKQADKVSILDDTINYLEELKRRVDDLESHMKVKEWEERRRKPQDTAEGTSNNFGSTIIGGGKRTLMNKRKVCDIEGISETDLTLLKDGAADDVTVSVMEKDALVEIRCRWRESLLLEIMDMLSKFQLDCHAVQSSITDGVLSLTVKSKLKESAAVSVGMLRQALQSVIWKF